MKSVHLIITDLFLPADFAAEVCASLSLPALEKLLSRGATTPSTAPARGTPVGAPPLSGDPAAGSGRTGEGASLEALLCEAFGVGRHGDAAVAAVSAAYDGLVQGCWLRADPVHQHFQREQLLLSGVTPSAADAQQMCASLNEYFAGQGMEFAAPHPQRWYVRLDAQPRIQTRPLSQVIGANVRGALPAGLDAPRWHQLLNEIQMLLHAHPVNQVREARGEVAINSLWLWGGGSADVQLPQHYQSVHTDEVLAEMFAKFTDAPCLPWPQYWRAEAGEGKQLLVWTALRRALQEGDLHAWRSAVQDFEINYAQPLWQALRSGKLARLDIEIVSASRVTALTLKRADAWAFWRRSKGLVGHGLV